MRAHRLMAGCIIAGVAASVAGSLVVAQVGRGGSQWWTPLGDAQRTSWLRTDDKISVQTLANPGFALQWQSKLGNQPRGLHGLSQGVTAAGVTLFVPMSLVAGSSNNLYAIDNDLGYVVWERRFTATLPAPTPACPGGITAGATRIVRLDATVPPPQGFGGGRGAVGYRSLLGEPGQGAPVEGRGGAAAAGRGAGAPAGAPPAAGRGAGAPAPPAPGAGQRGAAPPDRIPGTPRAAEGQGGGFGFLSRPSGVGYVISSDGMLHVVGLASGKDLQKPAPFVPANAKWSSPVAVDTTLYTSTSAGCGDAPHAVWAIDLDNEAKPVVSWKTNGGPVVGAVAFTSDGTLIAAVGSGQTTGDGKANAIVALDAKTLQVKDWFTQPSAEFATGPTILRHRDREVVVAATKDGRVLVLDAKSLGGADHQSPLHASKPWVESGGSVSADALAAWQQTSAGAISTSWVLLPVSGRVASGATATNGAISSGAVVALKLVDAGSALSLEPGWVSHNVSAPATPLTVNGVVFALSTGRPSTPDGRGTPAVLHAYDGATGKRLFTSNKSMTTFASPGSLWTGLGQIYVGAHDGTLYAFGFNDERRATNE
jgi:hypothetical protein